jgi:hypothetical protein
MHWKEAYRAPWPPARGDGSSAVTLSDAIAKPMLLAVFSLSQKTAGV